MDSSAQLTPPRVEFYVLGSAAAQDRLRAACQLAGKGWRAGLPVFIRCTDDAQLTNLDELLWHFRGEAFIPHNRHADNPTAPVVLGLEETPEARQGLLINLHSQLCQHLQGFSRIIEIVSQEPQQLAACRENFRLYRQKGYDPRRVEL